MKNHLATGLIALGLLASMPARAQPVGELHRVTFDQTAALRDAAHNPNLRITVWYPAAKDSVETPLTIGPPDKPLFDIGRVARDAAFATDSGPRPIILLSHGFGGTARIMGWFGIPLARNGYFVVAVDHPGNNTADKLTLPGAMLWWDRAEDLRIALQAVEQDPAISPHLDTGRIAAAGMSLGGFTALVLGGARVDRGHLQRLCAANPNDVGCRPPPEFSFSAQDVANLFQRPEVQADAAHAGEDHSIPNLRAIFAMAPAVIQGLDAASLAAMRTPTSIILGNADTIAPPATNGETAAHAIPGARLQTLPAVGHYDFLATCTAAGRAVIPFCDIAVPQAETHAATIATALQFFNEHLSTR